MPPPPDKFPILGQVALFAGSFAPKGWALCAGQLLSINQNVALFSLLSTKYGGDGKTTFALQDLRSKAPVSGQSKVDDPGLNYIIALQGDWPSQT